jgi:4-hydroxybenzoate polyprenyltransferase
VPPFQFFAGAAGSGGDPIPAETTTGNRNAVRTANRFVLILQAIRPKQWIKNLVVFAPLVFADRLLVLEDLSRTVGAFFLFCLLTGAVYLINDVADRERDRIHPEKSSRPVASGALPVANAVVAAAVLMAASLAAAWWWYDGLAAVLTIYLAQNLAYSFWLKHVVIVDVMSIAAGFLLRAIAGAVAIGVEISPWLILCTILLSLFLGFCKRRQELIGLAEQAQAHRGILSEYSTRFLDQMISVVTTATLMAYAFYTLSPEVQVKLGTDKLYLTLPFVLYGIFRYLYLVYRLDRGGNPTRALLTDRPLLLNVSLWCVAVVTILYLS